MISCSKETIISIYLLAFKAQWKHAKFEKIFLPGYWTQICNSDLRLDCVLRNKSNQCQ